jgi:hypothetical protein
LSSSGGFSIVSDPTVGRAVAGIVQNAEEQSDTRALEHSFVDIGVLAQLKTPNSQILFGRRGAGKSHLLRLLAEHQNRERASAAVYIDLRYLGSAQMMTAPTASILARCVSLFRDLLAQLQSNLFDLAADPSHPERANAFESVSKLYDTIAAVSSRVAARDISTQHKVSEQQSSSFSATLSAAPAVKLDLGSKGDTSMTVAEKYTEVFEDTVIFSEIGGAIDRVLDALGVESFVLLLDEWTTIPPDLQPYIAEYLKRTSTAITRMKVKIGSLRLNAVLSVPGPSGGRIGFEFGNQINRIIDLDSHYTFGSDPDAARQAFSDLLWRHLVSLLPDKYLQDAYGISSASDLRLSLFEADACFDDLLDAASGIARDFLSTFTIAYFRAAATKTTKVEAAAVRDAARIAFEGAKLPNLSIEQEQMLYLIALDLQARNAGGVFALGRDDSSNGVIQTLFDARVIHIVKSGYHAPSSAGPTTIYCLDYGVGPWLGLPANSGAGVVRAGLYARTISPPLLDLASLSLPSL